VRLIGYNKVMEILDSYQYDDSSGIDASTFLIYTAYYDITPKICQNYLDWDSGDEEST
jgi:hypothetical protein